MNVALSILSAVLSVASGAQTAASLGQPVSLAEMAQRYCLGPDGDHRLTWSRAEADGFEPFREEDLQGLRLLGVYGVTLKGYRKAVGGSQFDVITAASWLQGPSQGRTYSRYCWVSSSDARRSVVERELSEIIGVDRFRSERVRVFAWIPRPDGTNEPVGRRDYFERGIRLAREQGMRQATLRQYGDAVFIGYISPRDEETFLSPDWSGPEPVPAS